LLKFDIKILLRKTGARLIFKIAPISLHIDPEVAAITSIQDHGFSVINVEKNLSHL
jgi:hypothetical protein